MGVSVYLAGKKKRVKNNFIFTILDFLFRNMLPNLACTYSIFNPEIHTGHLSLLSSTHLCVFNVYVC